MRYFIVNATCFLLLSVASRAAEETHLDRVVRWMSGSFASTEQHGRDTANYFDIRLQIKRIWPERTDGVWLYVEQAMAQALDRPYRQRIYKVVEHTSEKIESIVFTLPNPKRFIGAYGEPSKLSGLTPDSLSERKGCSVYLSYVPSKTSKERVPNNPFGNDNGSYRGSTGGKNCESDLRGAKYASSEVSIWAEGMVTWDKGFNANDEQVWGASAGGYEFKKIGELR